MVRGFHPKLIAWTLTGVQHFLKLITGSNTLASLTFNGNGGTGTITIGTGTTILAGTAARSIGNATSVSGDFTFGGTTSTNNLTLVNTMTLAAGAHTITVTSPQVTATISGQITGGTNLTKAGAGTLILSSATANNYGGSTTVSGGVLQLGLAAVIPDASALIVAAGAALDLNGKAETLGTLAGDTTTTGGMITNSVSGTSATLTIGADNTSTTYAGILTDTKAGVATTGNLLLTNTGTGLQTLTGKNTYSGATTIGGTAGGLQIQNTGSNTSATLGNTAITVGSGVSLMATVASGAPTTVINIGSTTVTTEGASVTLSAGAKLDMRDNALGTFNILEGSTFGLNGLTASATSTLYFDIGSVSAVSGVYGGADKITITKNAAITSGATINLNAVTGATGIATGVIQLITSGGGFTGTGTNNFTLANPTLTLSGAWGSKIYNLTLSGVQDTTTQTALNVTIVAPTTAYWSGALDGSWSTNNAGGVTNWRTDATSNVDTQATPDATTNVFFNTTTPVAANLTTSNLTTATSIASLTFTSSATGAVTIGNNGISANTLTIGAVGITHSSSSGASTLGMSVILAASQTWTNNSTNALAVNGSTITGSGKNLTVAGTGDTTIAAAVQTTTGGVTKQDSGKLLLTATNTYAGATQVTGGNLQVGSGGIGSASSSAVTVSGAGTTSTVSGVSGTPVTTSIVSANQLAAPTLSGTGSVGAVTLGSLSTVGVLRPGDAAGSTPGMLTLTGALTVNSGSQIQFSVTSSSHNAVSLDSGWDSAVTAATYLGTHATAGGGTPDSIYTQWNTVGGTYSSLSLAGQTLSLGASVGGTPTVLIQTAGTATLAWGDIFKLMDWSSVGSGTAGSLGTPLGSSAFDTANDLVLPELSSGLLWDTSAFSSYGIVVIVPEPGRMVLILFGLAALFLRRRRTQARSIG
ncbi:MAG: autotransporter-associated beta strand repeat-containing protein [Verrucomicrobia bacterium]|nr:autotransporter-associated beta strand repeat-containing protein [Verrucomicrobiota bacterium]